MTAIIPLHKHVDEFIAFEAWCLEHEDEIVANGGQLTPEMALELDRISENTRQRVERLGLWIIEMKADRSRIKLEVERLNRRCKTLDATVDSVEQYVEMELLRMGTTKIRSPMVTVWVQRNGKASVRHNLSETVLRALHQQRPELIRWTPESFDLDKDAVGRLPESEVPDGVIVEVGNHLRVS